MAHIRWRTAAAASAMGLVWVLLIGDSSARRLHREALTGAGASLPRSQPQPPVAPKRAKLLKTGNDTRVDSYYWLRDDNRTSPEVLAYLKAENKYTAEVMADTKDLQAELFRELKSRIKEDDSGVPERYLGYWYFGKIGKGQQYGVHIRSKIPPGTPPANEKDAPVQAAVEEVLMDENARKAELNVTFYMLDELKTSPNNKLMAWSEDAEGGEKYTVHAKDLATGKELMEPIRQTNGPVVWANDNATLFYVLNDETDRPNRVMRHKLGTPTSDDVVVYTEDDVTFRVGITKSFDERLIYITSSASITSETRYADADDLTGEFKIVLPRSRDVEYSVRHHAGPGPGQDWWLLGIRDKDHPNSELRVAPMSDPRKQTVVMPHRKDVQIQGVTLSKKYILVGERANASTRVVLIRLPADGGPPKGHLWASEAVEFDEPAYTLSGTIAGDWDSDVVRLHYESMTTPPRTIDMDATTGRRAVRKIAPVLGGFNKDDYATKRLWAMAVDGVRVPISLVYRKALFKKDGSAPLLLTGYGSYGISQDPEFDSEVVSLLDRGWVSAIAHIRGGGDMGRLWYEDGKLLVKKNTFTDFIACAKHLIVQNYTAPKRLAIEGRSAGGLLMGAVLNLRPDLFAAAIAGVPFVDALTTMLDDSIPLTTGEYDEWGNPQDPVYYSCMKSYSPVDNVRPQRYPNMLVTAGLHDPRVAYWEPAKWVAKLRAAKTDHNLLLLKTELGAGHFSVTGRFDRLKDTALEYAFLLKTLGMEAVRPLPGTGKASSEPATRLPKPPHKPHAPRPEDSSGHQQQPPQKPKGRRRA